MRRIIVVLLLITYCCSSQAQKAHRFTLGNDQFLLDGKPIRLISGEMHPARIPKAYWRHRIQLAKAMGCNTIAAYIFWNYHEVKPGVFDFRSENRDIAEFVRICQQEKMWVLFRPGPYVCAEWDFGGLPVSLLKIPDIKVRCMDPRYMQAVGSYIRKLAAEIKQLQCTRGGPILMVQVENEYGSYGNDRVYMETLRKMWMNAGITVPFYTADGPTRYMLEAGSLSGTAVGLDSGSSEADFELARKMNPGVPVFSSETYPGWLTHWGEKWQRPDTNALKKEVEFLLKSGKSFNLYVIHGGTNFGFTAGANAFSPTAYQPDITSYDYDAPISEQGQPTAKYFMLRNLIAKYADKPLPPVPQPVRAQYISEILPERIQSVWDILPAPVYTAQPVPMEMLNQNQGLMLYRTRLIGHKSGKLVIREPHDYALVFLNGRFLDTVFRDGGNWTVDIPKDTSVANPVLDILVEGMGHINFAQYMIDRKGITDRVTLNGMTLMNWEQYSLPMDEAFLRKAMSRLPKTADERNGQFFRGYFTVGEQPGDTFFDMTGYVKGMVYVNGHLLGRHWNIGPQKRLFCPATWLKKGKNEIIIFDLHQQVPNPVWGLQSMNE